MPKTIVLAFSILSSGSRACDETIGIGASVVDECGRELDSLCLKGYFPGLTKFEQRTWDEFYSKKEEMKTLAADDLSKLSSEQMQEAYKAWPKLAIMDFHAFRVKWEQKARAEGWKLELVADNKMHDGGFINNLYAKYLVEDGSKIMPLPYSASDEPPVYKPFRETYAQQRGLLIAIDPASIMRRGQSMSKRIEMLFDCTMIRKAYVFDSNPAHNAYCTAREAVILNGIRKGHIKISSGYSSELDALAVSLSANAKSMRQQNRKRAKVQHSEPTPLFGAGDKPIVEEEKVIGSE